MAPPQYNLPGTKKHPQVEPSSGFWLRCPVLCTVRLEELLGRLGPIPPFPVAKQPDELKGLLKLHANRTKPVPNLSRLLTDPIFYQPAPAGAVLRDPTTPISTGVELASLFESETPGLWHRHIVNVIFEGGPAMMLSPPRQALIWAALDVAIVSALSAAWHFKWVGGTGVGYRQRPVEFDPTFPVLFDLVRAFPDRTVPKPPNPAPSPGTPRHPSYPSGHSTYSAAASRVLGCLFDGYKDPRPQLSTINWKKEFDLLADNIGFARLYGGVHWASDHDFGQKVGNTVGDLVIEQLNKSGIEARPKGDPKVPPPDQVRADAEKFGRNCGKGQQKFCGGFAPKGIERMQMAMTMEHPAPAAD